MSIFFLNLFKVILPGNFTLRGRDTFSGVGTLPKWVCLPSGKRFTLKGKSFLTGSRFFLLGKTPFQKGSNN